MWRFVAVHTFRSHPLSIHLYTDSPFLEGSLPLLKYI